MFEFLFKRSRLNPTKLIPIKNSSITLSKEKKE